MSNDTISRRINNMSNDIENQLSEKIKKSIFYAIQLDESTDMNNEAILLMYVRYVDTDLNDIQEEFFCCLNLKTYCTSEEMFNAISSHFQKINLQFSNCIGICTDGAAAMTGKFNGLVTRVQQIAHKNIISTHCFIHREQLAAKDMNENLFDVLNICIKIVNFIRASAVNTRVFKVMCEEMDSGFKNLLLHTHVRWLSRGKVLTRLFELKTEVEIFLRDKKSPLSDYFENNVWLAKLAYLTDIFSILNELNLKEHLGRLREKMSKYFDPTKDIRKNCNWVINPFVQSDQNILSLTNEEKLIELSADVDLHKIFRSNKNIGQFWIKVQNEYPSLAEEALKLLIPFSTSYLCENGFSTLTTIINKTRNRLEISSAMRISLTKSIKPRIDEIISHQQQQPSH
ncbi:hypothetical protein QTP88_026255 [Uroleucon formosanum]